MKRTSGISVLIAGFVSIVIVTIVNFNKDYISEYVYKSFHDFVIPKENDYFLDSNYLFLNNYTDEINNKEEFINYIYYVINSGSTFANGECSNTYTNCYKDYEKIVDKDNSTFLSNVNNFVHPYNSFEKIKFKNTGFGIFSITINHTYNEEQINEINEIVNNVISKYITSEMTTVEKIKIIHDYIIENTDYDQDNNESSKIAYGVFKNHLGICNGYADAISIFLNSLGIKNYKIGNDNHVWNLVLVNGKWLHLDATWDDPISEKKETSYSYFLIDTNTLVSLNDETHDFDKTIFKEAA